MYCHNTTIDNTPPMTATSKPVVDAAPLVNTIGALPHLILYDTAPAVVVSHSHCSSGNDGHRIEH